MIIQSKDIEGWLVANNAGLTVALDIQLTPELVQEGIARELINRLQNLRKDAGLEVTDKIILYLEEDVVLSEVLNQHQNYIQQETLAVQVIVSESLNDGEAIDFDQIKTRVKLEKA